MGGQLGEDKRGAGRDPTSPLLRGDPLGIQGGWLGSGPEPPPLPVPTAVPPANTVDKGVRGEEGFRAGRASVCCLLRCGPPPRRGGLERGRDPCEANDVDPFGVTDLYSHSYSPGSKGPPWPLRGGTPFSRRAKTHRKHRKKRPNRHIYPRASNYVLSNSGSLGGGGALGLEINRARQKRTAARTPHPNNTRTPQRRQHIDAKPTPSHTLNFNPGRGGVSAAQDIGSLEERAGGLGRGPWAPCPGHGVVMGRGGEVPGGQPPGDRVVSPPSGADPYLPSPKGSWVESTRRLQEGTTSLEAKDGII